MQNQAVAKHRDTAARILLPEAPVLTLAGGAFYALTPDGEIKTLNPEQARQLVTQQMPVCCHAPHLARRLGIERFPAYDVLELFSFVHPAQFCVPTAAGLAQSLNLLEPEQAEDHCLSLLQAARHLLLELSSGREETSNPAGLAGVMGLGLSGNGDLSQGWPWTPVVLAALNRTETPPSPSEMRVALQIWNRLPEWAEHAPEPPPGHFGVNVAEAEQRLTSLLIRGDKEPRPQQMAYTAALTHAFTPNDNPDAPNIVLAEAGTGTGKTLGYLAPATVWAEKNEGTVWISTYTRNLQRQVDEELDRLYPDRTTKAVKSVIRKGRENYLCLLNFEDATQSQTLSHSVQNAVAVGLMTRWIAITRDGDFSGADFPGWMVSLLGWNRTVGFADRSGECVYAGCPHFNRCFIEKSLRKAKRADVVIANHALVMHQTAYSDPEDNLPRRYVFDEGHHLFEAADSAFGSDLSGRETADLRRWLLGAEGGSRSRARGLKRRIEELIENDEDALQDLSDILEAARSLPGPSWRARVFDGTPKGVTENFLSLAGQQVKTRCKDQNPWYSLETDVRPPIDGLFESAYALSLRLNDLKRPMLALVAKLTKKLNDDAADLDTETRNRLTAAAISLQRRASYMVGSWIDMLEALKTETPATYVDWLQINRIEGYEEDIALCRRYVDPTAPFAASLKPHAHGVAITSATLRDSSGNTKSDWESAEVRTGMPHLTDGITPPERFDTPSPFDYQKQTRVLIVGDVDKKDSDQVAAAFRELFRASNGGALGIFTAVQRLKAIQERLSPTLEKEGMTLYSQHLDGVDVSTLIDMFKGEENACLLGTDATRDGIDVPGRSLRLIVFDRVPWPRPTLLHKARRSFFGKGYDDMLTRFKLKQAYGRLIRRSDDKGIFILLDGACPTRLTSAFPEGVEVERIGLKEAITITKTFLRE